MHTVAFNKQEQSFAPPACIRMHGRFSKQQSVVTNRI
jgi:hypothetical protein